MRHVLAFLHEDGKDFGLIMNSAFANGTLKMALPAKIGNSLFVEMMAKAKNFLFNRLRVWAFAGGTGCGTFSENRAAPRAGESEI